MANFSAEYRTGIGSLKCQPSPSLTHRGRGRKSRAPCGLEGGEGWHLRLSVNETYFLSEDEVKDQYGDIFEVTHISAMSFIINNQIAGNVPSLKCQPADISDYPVLIGYGADEVLAYLTGRWYHWPTGRNVRLKICLKVNLRCEPCCKKEPYTVAWKIASVWPRWELSWGILHITRAISICAC